MSRNIIVGLAVLIVAALAWIVIDQFDDGTELADAPIDSPLTTAEDEGAVVVVDPDAEPVTNVEEVVEAATDGSEADTEVVAEATETAIDEAVDEEVVIAAEEDSLSLTEESDAQELEIVEATPSDDAETLVEATDGADAEVAIVEGTADAADGDVEVLADATDDDAVSVIEGGDPQALEIVEGTAGDEPGTVDVATDSANDATRGLSNDAVETLSSSEEATEALSETGGEAVAGGVEAVTEDADVVSDEMETAALDAEGLSEEGVETLPSSEEATVELSDEAGEAVEGTAEETESLFAGTDAEIQEVPVDAGDATSGDRPELAELLTADGFDADAVIAYIDESDLAEPAKISLRTVVRTAEDDEDLVPTVIDRVRDALDVE